MSTDNSFPDDAYVPDAEADTALVVDGFYRHLAESQGLSAALIAAVRVEHERLVAANAHLVVDEAARHNVRMTLALVAAYEALCAVTSPDAARAAVHEAFVEPLADVVRGATTAMLDGAPDPFRAMVELARAREGDAFGAGFAFEHPADDDTRFFADVRRCHYHDTLAANGAAELTPVMCAFDANWIEAIDPARHGFRFDRVTTIGFGGDHCPFHFTRVGDPEREEGLFPHGRRRVVSDDE
jgi:hypothetical protein